MIDGVPLTDNRSPSFSPEIPADDVQSLSIYTANFPAEYGRKMGGVVEMETRKDSRPGWHGEAAATGGSNTTAAGHGLLQDVVGEKYIGIQRRWRGDGLVREPRGPAELHEPAVPRQTGKFHSRRDLTDRDRIEITVRHEQSVFEVPNERVKQAAGPRQDRNNKETMSIFSFQHIFSPDVLGEFHAMVRQDSDAFWSNPLSTPIIAFQNRGFKEGYLKGTVAVHHGRQEWKAGAESDFTPLHEGFSDTITDFSQFDKEPRARLTSSHGGTIMNRLPLSRTTSVWVHGASMPACGGTITSSCSTRMPSAHGLELPVIGKPPTWSCIFRTTGFFRLRRLRIFCSLALPKWQASIRNFCACRCSRRTATTTRPVSPRTFSANSSWTRLYRRYLTNYADDDLLLNTSVSFPIAFRKAEIYGRKGSWTFHVGRLHGIRELFLPSGVCEFSRHGRALSRG